MSYRICKKCIMDTNFPDISFNEKGICNICTEHEKRRAQGLIDYKTSEKDFVRLTKRDKKGDDYDCLCLYSGGKDSTYMLYTLVNKYKLRVLAFTLDNWFISKGAFANIDRVLSKLDVDHIIFKPSWKLASSLFRAGITNTDASPKSKEMAFLIGHICWPCFVMLSIFSIKIALEKNIHAIVVGTTPGQLRQKENNLLTKYTGIIDVYQHMIHPFLEIIPDEYRKILDLSLIDKIRSIRPKLVPFYEYHKYDEHKHLKVLKSKLGWQRPKDTDPCSTNCRINALGIRMHKSKYNINPYVVPLAHDVRIGVVSRKKALKDTSCNIDIKAVKDIVRRLGIKKI